MSHGRADILYHMVLEQVDRARIQEPCAGSARERNLHFASYEELHEVGVGVGEPGRRSGTTSRSSPHAVNDTARFVERTMPGTRWFPVPPPTTPVNCFGAPEDADTTAVIAYFPDPADHAADLR